MPETDDVVFCWIIEMAGRSNKVALSKSVSSSVDPHFDQS